MQIHPALAFCVQADASIREALRCIEQQGQGIILVVDAAERLQATLTDGDLRRAILAGVSQDATVSQAIETTGIGPSIWLPEGTSAELRYDLMLQHSVQWLPLLDARGRPVELVRFRELDEEATLPLEAVIMAGGQGTRLRPLTNELPKPMLPIAGKPLIEHTIESLKQAGIGRINIATHYLPEAITSYFGSGQRHGVAINYLCEHEPLGTAGAIRLLRDGDDPVLVINGDILTAVNYRAMLEFHHQAGADLTLGARQHEVHVPYGVIESSEGKVQQLREKPRYDVLVNAGIYVVSATARRRIPPGRSYHMTDLIEALLADQQTVASFPIVEYWLDIGRHEDFLRAEQDVSNLAWAA